MTLARNLYSQAKEKTRLLNYYNSCVQMNNITTMFNKSEINSRALTLEIRQVIIIIFFSTNIISFVSHLHSIVEFIRKYSTCIYAIEQTGRV